MRRLVVVALLLVLATPLASAQTQLPADPGIITPRMGPLYQLEILWDNFMIMISPNKPLAKLSVMDERLAEYETTHNPAALNDYMSKASSLEQDLSSANQVTKSIVETKLKTHVKVLEEVKDKVPVEAKPAIERAINESTKCEEVIKKVCQGCENCEYGNCTSCQTQACYQTGKYHNVAEELQNTIEIPSLVSVGEKVKVSGTVCNPFNHTITALKIDVYAKKKGLEGFFVNRHESRTISVAIGPGECYTKDVEFTVPEGKWGISAKGYWEVRVVITAMPKNVVLVDMTKDVTIV